MLEEKVPQNDRYMYLDNFEGWQNYYDWYKDLSKPENDRENPNIGLFKFSTGNLKGMPYGEFIAYMIAKQCEIPACKVEFAKVPYWDGREAVGSLSFRHLKKDDEFTMLIKVFNEYCEKNNKDCESELNIEGVIDTIKYFGEKNNQSQEHINSMIRKIIDITIFDCTFANPDRSLYNLAVYKTKEGFCDIYPIYDNCDTLGFSTEERYLEDILRLDDKLFSTHVASNYISYLGIPERLDYARQECTLPVNVVQYLLENYPEETKLSIEKVSKFTKKDLDKLLLRLPNLDPRYKFLAQRIFTDRFQKLSAIYDKSLQDKTFDSKEMLKAI